jgi:hypothetical protein
MAIRELIRKGVEEQIVFCDECEKQIGEIESLTMDAWGSMAYFEIRELDAAGIFCDRNCALKFLQSGKKLEILPR